MKQVAKKHAAAMRQAGTQGPKYIHRCSIGISRKGTRGRDASGRHPGS